MSRHFRVRRLRARRRRCRAADVWYWLAVALGCSGYRCALESLEGKDRESRGRELVAGSVDGKAQSRSR